MKLVVPLVRMARGTSTPSSDQDFKGTTSHS